MDGCTDGLWGGTCMWGHEDEQGTKRFILYFIFLLFRQPPTKVPTMTFRDNGGGAATLARLETIGNGRDDRGARIDRVGGMLRN